MMKPRPTQINQGNVTAPKLVSTEVNTTSSTNQSAAKMKEIQTAATPISGTTFKDLINHGRA
jgi:hypothetical protein